MTIARLKLSGNTPVNNDALDNVATKGANKLRYFLINHVDTGSSLHVLFAAAFEQLSQAILKEMADSTLVYSSSVPMSPSYPS